MVTYELALTTSKAKGAGTNARAYAKLMGEMGSSDESYLYANYSQDFDTGNTDTFTLTCADLGQLKSLSLRMVGGLKTDGVTNGLVVDSWGD